MPRNPQNPWYVANDNPDGKNWVDLGLGAVLANDQVYGPWAKGQLGKQKVPTLRNIAVKSTDDTAKAYMHNGYFKTLEGVVNFYNTRDTKPKCQSDFVTEEKALELECWPAPEVAENMNKDELGNLKLTTKEEADLVAFLKSLSDR